MGLFKAAKFTIIHLIGAEVRVYLPRRAPLLSCGISSNDLQCVAVTGCNEDLGVQCLSRALLEQITADGKCQWISMLCVISVMTYKAEMKLMVLV